MCSFYPWNHGKFVYETTEEIQGTSYERWTDTHSTVHLNCTLLQWTYLDGQLWEIWLSQALCPFWNIQPRHILLPLINICQTCFFLPGSASSGQTISNYINCCSSWTLRVLISQCHLVWISNGTIKLFGSLSKISKLTHKL